MKTHTVNCSRGNDTPLPTHDFRLTHGIRSTVLLVAWLAITSAGCASRTAAPIKTSSQLVETNVPQWSTNSKFTVAAFYKPRDTGNSDLEARLAPLIVQQLHDEAGEQIHAHRFGLRVIDNDGTATVAPSQPTVYFGTRAVGDRGVEFRQVYYVWCYPHGGKKRYTEYSGVLMTLGSDGFPITWEPLRRVSRSSVANAPIGGDANPKAPRTIYVSGSLERLAEEQFGPPLAGRRFSIERAGGESSRVNLAGLVNDGPIPMGPYVYLGAAEHHVRTILCRCSPSQVDSFAETGYYDLAPIEAAFDLVVSLPEFRPSSLLRWPSGGD